MLPLSLFALCVIAARSVAYDWDQPTALDDYVHLDDGAFTWSEIGQYRFDADNVTVYLLNMTSQRWMDESFSSHPIWWHMMGVAVPDVIKRDVSYMWVDGGGNSEDTQPPSPDAGVVNAVRLYARLTGYFASFVLQVPNQQITFWNDPTGNERTEDEIIAWTWRSYVTEYTDTPQVIARMPMTKSVVRAMDAAGEFVAQRIPGHSLNQFIVGGGSKRGWTTWSTAATDRRVIAATPMVMSLMNFNDTLQAHYRNLGGWSIAFFDYYVLNLTSHIHDDIVTNWDYGLWTYEDMFRYKERLTQIPILLVSATGDEFFLLTDSHTWLDEMLGNIWMMMVPNAEHSLSPWYLKIGQTVASWSTLLLEQGPGVPKLDWLRGDTGDSARISLFIDQVPDNLTAWYAHNWKNDTRKDFRLAVGYPPFIHPIRWFETPVIDHGNGQYDVELPTPDAGFGGIFIECLWTRLTGLPMYLTTEVQVTPDIYPFPPCYGAECKGELV